MSVRPMSIRRLSDWGSLSRMHQLLGQSKRSTKIANNTKATRHPDGSITITLHWTDIVKLNVDGSVTLDSGGYRSTTTKQRINAFLPEPWGLVQKDYEWYLVDRFSGDHVPFYDGMVVK